MSIKPGSIIAVDFDGVVVVDRFPDIGPELPLAIQTLKDLQKAGHLVVMWTCRYLPLDLITMGSWLTDRDFKPDAVNANLCEGFSPHPKIYADFYLDDRNWPPFPGWYAFREWAELDQIDETNEMIGEEMECPT